MSGATETVEPPVKAIARPTTFIKAPKLSAVLGSEVTIASETFQWTGSFKFRAAYNLAASRPEEFFITASSGNFGQALAYACKLLGKRCTIVMPETSAKVKIEGTKSFGGTVDLVDVKKKNRAERVAELAKEFPEAFVASAFDDPHVVEGNSTLGLEIAPVAKDFDFVIAPIGGGGLISGIVAGMRKAGVSLPVIGAEPLLGNDAARSLAAGHIISNRVEPDTIADGARTLAIGKNNWEYIKTGVNSIVEVPDEHIEEAVRLLFLHANLKAEPTGALTCGALLTSPERFKDKRCLLVVSGGNVDPATYLRIIQNHST